MSRNAAYDQQTEELKSLFTSVHNLRDFFGCVPAEKIVSTAVGHIANMHETYVQKDTDYSANDKPMGNMKESVEMGIPPWRGVLLRIGDKKRRIESFVKRSEYLVKDEGVNDTLIDLSNYSLLMGVLFTEETSDTQEVRIIQDLCQQMAFSAICARILYDLQFLKEYGVMLEPWTAMPWEMLQAAYERLAAISRGMASGMSLMETQICPVLFPRAAAG